MNTSTHPFMNPDYLPWRSYELAKSETSQYAPSPQGTGSWHKTSARHAQRPHARKSCATAVFAFPLLLCSSLSLHGHAQTVSLYAGGAHHSVGSLSDGIYEYSSPWAGQFGARCAFVARRLELALSLEHATKQYTLDSSYPGASVIHEEGRLEYTNVSVLLSPGQRDSVSNQFRIVFGLAFRAPYHCSVTKQNDDGTSETYDPAIADLKVGAALALGGRYTQHLDSHLKLFS